MPNDLARVERLFHAASVLPDAHRDAFVARECGGDQILREQVLALLAADTRAEARRAFAEPVGAAFVQDAVDRALPALAVGTTVGPYTILQRIGEGGFGQVYLAERRVPMVQQVAIKVIKPGMDSRAVLRRFEIERRALAAMSHPNIARILDAGATPAGLPYFAMEYVPGVPITAYCRERSLSLRDCLPFFVDVCRAVQHAHSKGVIHRDIKPDNILVMESDGRAIPKVIDFGIARLLDTAGWGGPVQTEQAPSIGTPTYMSPEQASFGQQDIDARTDVYGLGVVLYELIAGLPPFDPLELRRVGFDEARRIIREVEPPPPRVRARRFTELAARADGGARPRRLPAVPAIPRELEWIPLKAMRKDRDDRYSTPESIATDVERFLAGLALLAGPRSNAYLARKFIGRNRWPVLLAVILALGLIAFAVEGRVVRRRERVLLAEARSAQARATAEAERAMVETYGAEIAAAASALQTGDAFSARARLEGIDPARRAWEWQFLWLHTDETERAFVGHSGPITSARFSPDGSMLASGGWDMTARLWDTASGRQLALFDDLGGDDRISVAFSPDGRELLVANYDGLLRVFSTADFRLLRTLTLPGRVQQLDVSRDGTLLFVFNRAASEFQVLRADSGTLVARAGEGVNCFAIFPDDSRAALGCIGRVDIVRIPGGAIVGSIPIPGGHPAGVAVSNRGDRIAIALTLSRVMVVDAATLARVAEWGDACAAGPVRFVSDDTVLVVGSGDERIHAWRIADEQPLGSWTAPGLRPRVQDVCARGPWVASGSHDGQLRLLRDVPDSTWIPETIPRQKIHLTVSSDGERFACGSALSPRVIVLDVQSRRTIRTFEASGALAGVLFGRTHDELFVADVNGVRRVDVPTGRATTLLESPTHQCRLLLSPDSHTLAVGNLPDQTVLLDLEAGTLRSLGTPGPGRARAFSPDGRSLLCDLGDVLRRVDAATGALITEFSTEPSPIASASFSPDGVLVASTGWDDRTLRVWNSSTGALVTSVRAADAYFTPTFLPDGSRLLAGDEAGRLHAWDTATWRQVLSWKVHAGWCWLAPDASCRTLLSCGDDAGGSTVRILEAPAKPSADPP